MQISRENNFDMIRLVAALQVVMGHSLEHLHFQNAVLDQFAKVISYFPGVAIFFTVSGFLIYASYDRNRDLKTYARNRFLRIFPALWACLLITIALLTYFGFIYPANIFTKPFVLWLATQLSFLQYYTPDMFRRFGVGTPNGSLWTIPIEISFYIVVPMIFFLIRRLKVKANVLLLVLCVMSFAFNYWYNLNAKVDVRQHVMAKILEFNLLPYLFYFLFGP